MMSVEKSHVDNFIENIEFFDLLIKKKDIHENFSNLAYDLKIELGNNMEMNELIDLVFAKLKTYHYFLRSTDFNFDEYIESLKTDTNKQIFNESIKYCINNTNSNSLLREFTCVLAKAYFEKEFFSFDEYYDLLKKVISHYLEIPIENVCLVNKSFFPLMNKWVDNLLAYHMQEDHSIENYENLTKSFVSEYLEISKIISSEVANYMNGKMFGVQK